MDPFAMALDALFNAPGSMAAVYTGAGDAPVAIRVIRSRPDHFERFGGFQVDVRGETFEIRRSDIALPAIGDTIAIGSEKFEVSIEPLPDVEGLSWMLLADPVS